MEKTNIENGFLKISRKLFNNDLWTEKRQYSRFEAWLDLIQMARYGDDAKKDGILRGELSASTRFLRNRWGWGNSKITSYLRYLEDNEMVVRKMVHKETIITICKYDDYNTSEFEDGAETGDNKKNIKKKEIKKKKESDQFSEAIDRIFAYLNEVCEKNFRASTKPNRAYVSARLSEGYSEDELKQVIDVKSSQWKNDKVMNSFLRPSTLFAPSKFESYLNEISHDNSERGMVY